MFASADYQGWFLLGDQLSAGCACRGPAFGLDSCEAVKPAQHCIRKISDLVILAVYLMNFVDPCRPR